VRRGVCPSLIRGRAFVSTGVMHNEKASTALFH
jgi:hypothetical protein